MTTEKQKQANINNSVLGGVKTDIGKAVTKYNAVKHGIFRVTVSDYENGFHEEVLDELIEQNKPIGFLETLLVERMALCYLRLYRLAKAEFEFMQSRLHPFQIIKHNPVQEDFQRLTEHVEKWEYVGYQPKLGIESIKDLEHVLLKYDTTIENKLYKALHELQRLQAIRLGHPVSLPAVLDISIDKNFEE